MNKEAKIGLIVILAMIITFAAVLARRLYNSYAADQSAAAQGKDEKAADSAPAETSNKPDKNNTASSSADQPTVVTATNILGKMRGGNGQPWGADGDSRKADAEASRSAELNSPPSYMPEPPKPDVDENRRDGYGTADGASSRAQRYADWPNSSPPRDSVDDRYASRPAAADGPRDYRSRPRRHASAVSTATRTYTVAEGDSLFDIARAELGKASRWVEIYDLNADVIGKDIDNPAPGTQLALPNDDPR
jgi:nucleoid-associated protein YgaU